MSEARTTAVTHKISKPFRLTFKSFKEMRQSKEWQRYESMKYAEQTQRRKFVSEARQRATVEHDRKYGGPRKVRV